VRVRTFAIRLGEPRERAYGDWREMLEAERKRTNRIDLVTIGVTETQRTYFR